MRLDNVKGNDVCNFICGNSTCNKNCCMIKVLGRCYGISKVWDEIEELSYEEDRTTNRSRSPSFNLWYLCMC